MKYSVGIVTIIERYNMALALNQKIGGVITIDFNRSGSWPTHLKAMLNFNPEKDYHLVVEDDIELCPDFPEAVDKCCGLFPNNPLSFFNMKYTEKANKDARSKHTHIINANGSTGQAILFPTKIMLAWVTWCNRYIPDTIPYEDNRLWAWSNITNTPIFITEPNLCNHLLPSNSSLGFNDRRRVSANFDPKTLGLSINWEQNLDIVRNNHKPIYDYSLYWKRTYAPIYKLWSTVKHGKKYRCST
jgi:hypothetical protein